MKGPKSICEDKVKVLLTQLGTLHQSVKMRNLDGGGLAVLFRFDGGQASSRINTSCGSLISLAYIHILDQLLPVTRYLCLRVGR